jgi:CDP-4-dehydro-6-deoxyglucose reductase
VSYEEFPLALTPEEAEQGYALACQARPLCDITLSLEPVAQASTEPQRCTAVVAELQHFTRDIVHLSLDLPMADGLVYEPGQYMNLFLDPQVHRSFSMASVPRGSRVDFHVRRIPGGRFTDSRLVQLRPGDEVEVEIPLGSFRCHKEDYRPLLMVATGTGLAPIKSMLESLLDDDDCPPVWLYWGMRHEADLYLDAEIRSWTDRLYEFQYVPVLSRAAGPWSGRRGHVQDAVVQDLPDLSEHSIYLCGSPNMINDAKRAFLAHGASLDHLHADGFSFQHHA